MYSSIGNGGIGTKCAETTTWKKFAKIPRSNISGICGMSGMCGIPRSNAKVKWEKSQGQIFQEFVECQGQMGKIPRSNISGICGMPRSNFPRSNGKNPKVKYFRNLWNFRNAKVKFPKVKYFRNVKVKFPKVKYFRNATVKCQGQEFQECQGQMPRSNAKVKCQGQISQGQMGKCNKNKKTINT